MNIKTCEKKAEDYAIENKELNLNKDAWAISYYAYQHGYGYAIEVLREYKDHGVMVDVLHEVIMLLSAHKHEN